MAGSALPQEFPSTASKGLPTSLACILNTEIQAVVAMMRQNATWAMTPHYLDGPESDDPLLEDFKILRRNIFKWQNWEDIRPVEYLTPFLEVVRSEKANTPITGVALTAVHKMLTLEVFGSDRVGAQEAMHAIIEAVTACRFEVTDQASEEVVLMKILQVLLACLKCTAGVLLTDRDVCNVVNTCFRVVNQSITKGELLQRMACYSLQEMIRTIFGRLPMLLQSDVLEEGKDIPSVQGNSVVEVPEGKSGGYINEQEENTDEALPLLLAEADASLSALAEEGKAAEKPHGVACMVEIFHFLCSLLSWEDSTGSEIDGPAGEEDMSLLALGLVNSALELAGSTIAAHPKLLALVQDELFRNLMQLGLSPNVLVLALVCSIVQNLYHTLRVHLKLQLEAFFTFVIVRLAQGRNGAPFQLQEIALETLVDFCRQPHFTVEAFANFDCNLTCANTFEELCSLLSKCTFPVNTLLSNVHVLSLEGLLAVVQAMADRVQMAPPQPPQNSVSVSELQSYAPYWNATCPSFTDEAKWVDFVRKQKFIKRRLMIGADHFNRDPKKGLEFLQSINLLPQPLDAASVAAFFRHTPWLNRNTVGEYLCDHGEFNVKVLQEFTDSFNFTGMTLDAALRTFLESFRMQGEAQKIARVMEAFAGRYYEQCPQVLANKDAAYILSYSVIMLNTDQHNGQVRRKMTEEEFIRNNRNINNGEDLPREILKDLYLSIGKNEIKVSDTSVGIPEMTQSRWMDLIRRSRAGEVYILAGETVLLDHDMFTIIAGPTIAAISVVFDHTEDEGVLQLCMEGFLAVARISSHHRLDEVLDDLVVSLCKFTTLLNPVASVEDAAMAFGEDNKARMAALTVFTIGNKFGDHIRTGWRNILDCVLRLHKLGLLPAKVTSEAEDPEAPKRADNSDEAKQALMVPPPVVSVTQRRPTGIIGHFSHFLALDGEDSRGQPTERQLASRQRTMQTIESCCIDQIFSDSRFLETASLLHLTRALIWAAGRPQKGGILFSPEDEDTAVMCLGLLVAVTLNNRDRIQVLWPLVSEHMATIVQSASSLGMLVDKAVFGLLRICQRLLPYKEELADDFLHSLQLILRLDARVADMLCERITVEVLQLVRANISLIKSPMGWRTVCSLLAITARHPDAAEPGFEALSFIMAGGAHLTSANYVPCLDAARDFAEARVGGSERSIRALDLLIGLIGSLHKWSEDLPDEPDNSNSNEEGREGTIVEDTVGLSERREALGASRLDASREGALGWGTQHLAEMWMRLLLAIRRICGEAREDVRNQAVQSLQRCLLAADGLKLPRGLWAPCFDQVIFAMLDELLDIVRREKPKEFKAMGPTIQLGLKLLSKVFLHFLPQLTVLPPPGFQALWLAVLSRMEMFFKVRLRSADSEQLMENIPEILKNMLLVMHSKGVLVQDSSPPSPDSLWALTWQRVHVILPDLIPEEFLAPPPEMSPSAAANSAPSPALAAADVAVTEGINESIEKQPDVAPSAAVDS